ncbi:MAG: cyclic nucleotide-binding domain-containing protein [Actinobacteria bacterium]|nr:cyclic nucleotide-binding domain-containing protein [Actinomycetota bacterium]
MIEDGDKPEPRTRADHSHTLVKALQAVPSLGICDERTLLEIVGDSVNLVWPAGHKVFEPGTPSSGLFIVLSGRVRVLRDGGDELAELGPGEHFGELSLLLGTMHQHAVEALEDTELMVVPKERFDALVGDNPRLAGEIRRKAEERMAMNRGDAPTD